MADTTGTSTHPVPYDLDLPDGRVLEVLEYGDPAGRPLLFHNGQPSAAVFSEVLDEVAREQGLRLLTSSRPGYGGSTPHPEGTGGDGDAGAPAYRVADDVADAAALLDAAGVEEFVTLGWSGGGPRALACAALLPDRCRAATSLAGVAPYEAVGLDWSAGMAEENVEEYATAAAGAQPYGTFLEGAFLPVLQSSPEELASALGGLVPPVDRAAMEGGLAPWMSAVFHRAGAQGVRGMRDDGLAVVAPWGFDVAAITVPVAIWHGTADTMVPTAHARWLADHVPDATLHVLDDEGHLSLVPRLGEILAELVSLAGWQRAW